MNACRSQCSGDFILSPILFEQIVGQTTRNACLWAQDLGSQHPVRGWRIPESSRPTRAEIQNKQQQNKLGKLGSSQKTGPSALERQGEPSLRDGDLARPG